MTPSEIRAACKEIISKSSKQELAAFKMPAFLCYEAKNKNCTRSFRAMLGPLSETNKAKGMKDMSHYGGKVVSKTRAYQLRKIIKEWDVFIIEKEPGKKSQTMTLNEKGTYLYLMLMNKLPVDNYENMDIVDQHKVILNGQKSDTQIQKSDTQIQKSDTPIRSLRVNEIKKEQEETCSSTFVPFVQKPSKAPQQAHSYIQNCNHLFQVANYSCEYTNSPVRTKVLMENPELMNILDRYPQIIWDDALEQLQYRSQKERISNPPGLMFSICEALMKKRNDIKAQFGQMREHL